MVQWIEWIKERKLPIILFILVAGGAIYFYLRPSPAKEEVPFPPYEETDSTLQTSTKEENPVQWIEVDVKGAVLHPGVYRIEKDSRVHEVLDKAGGATKEADLSQVNLAAFLQDGQVLYIPRVGEEEKSEWSAGASSSSTGAENGQRIDINHATLEELDRLPGIGPSKAEAIIRYREENGPFKDVKELANVSGIGEKTLEKLLPYIDVR